MAEVYAAILGKPFEDWLAHTPMVKGAVKREATARFRLATALHHHQEGHSFIELEKAGGPDWLVVLNDTRGLSAAMSIEYGRDSNAYFSKPWSGTQTLHRAFSLPIERTFPRSRRRKRFNPDPRG